MDYLALNRNAWNKRTRTHIESRFYDIEGFVGGKTSLNPIELGLLDHVSGMTLLHLQCHFGLDSLSWSRLGAKVTGVDLSSDAIDQATKLNSQLGLDAQFINEDLYSFGASNKTRYDIVFTSYGAVCWLPDLNRWAQTIAQALKAGGRFVLVEFHPAIDLLQGYSYFPKDVPDIEESGTYTENCSGEKSLMAVWSHSLGEVLQALTQAGLSIEGFQEYRYSPYNCFTGLEYVQGQGYQMPLNGQLVPLIYSVTATRR